MSVLKFTTLLKKSIPLGKNVLSITLPHEQHTLNQQQVTLDDGQEAEFSLPDGTVLQDGNYLQAESGVLVKIRLAKEKVSTLYCKDTVMFARACYHLGKRQVPIQIGQDMLRYQHDPILDKLLKGLNLQVVVEEEDFTPESQSIEKKLSNA